MRDPLAVPDGELVTHSPRAPVLSKRYQTAHRLSLDVRMDRAPPGGASCGQRGEQRSRNERHATLPWRPLLVPAGGSGSASATALVPAESRFRREGAVLSCASARTARIGDAVYPGCLLDDDRGRNLEVMVPSTWISIVCVPGGQGVDQYDPAISDRYPVPICA